MWRGGLGAAYLLLALSSAGASLARTMLRFHIPLIEPDGRISRIRLSDKGLTLSPTGRCGRTSGAGPVPALHAGMRQDSVSIPDPASCASYTTTRRSRSRACSCHAPVGLVNRTEAEVVRPTNQHPVDSIHLFLRRSASTIADRSTR